ncbi:MAG: Hsp33 family molecular chaperone HslO, partial [Oscillospiraceae bacterium]|nr:Hsp33 family molecular chaperone HslO [Oscillospiraceae bacterium]
MGKLVRTISHEGGVICIAVDSTDAIAKMEQIHKTSAVITAAEGRLLTAASIMGTLLKSKEDSITLRMEGNGPVGHLIAVSDGSGNVKGYMTNPVVELPLNSKGKLDVASAVGNNGFLYVIRDMGMKEPYIGQVPIVSGEIAEDITSYYALSEQIPTVCGLGVLVNQDLSVKAAGGFMVQLLPGATDEEIDRLEANIAALKPVSQMIEEGMTPQEIAFKVLDGFEPEVLDEYSMDYVCDCSR